VLGAFADAQTIARLEATMAREGVMSGTKMAATFDVLRANDLIFNYVVSIHSFYLHSLYEKNQLASGELVLAGQPLSLKDIKCDTYLVGAVNDHIVPWMSSYKATGLLGGSVRYVLSSGGHIAGIVNPPSQKAWYQVAEHHRQHATQWREGAERRAGSWWEDWAAWSDSRAGQLIAPPQMGGERFPALGPAPGDYVRG